MKKSLVFAPLVIIIVALAGWRFLWGEGARTMRSEIDRFVADQRAAGLQVEYEAVSVRGFPFVLRGVVDAPQVTRADGAEWRGERIFIDASPTAPNRLVFSFPGEQIVTLANQTWRLKDGALRASIEATDDGTWLGKAEGGPLQASDGTYTFTAMRYIANLSPDADDPYRHHASAVVSGAAVDGGPLEGRPVVLDQLEFGGALNVGQRRMDIAHLLAKKSESEASLSGALTLSPTGAFNGAFDAVLKRPAALVDVAMEAGVLAGQDADAVKAALLMAAVAGGGVVKTPIVIEDGVASIDGAPVFQTPRVNLR